MTNMTDEELQAAVDRGNKFVAAIYEAARLLCDDPESKEEYETYSYSDMARENDTYHNRHGRS